jgi:hypothetical protein
VARETPVAPGGDAGHIVPAENPLATASQPAPIEPAAAASETAEPEENIYEVMKQHMARKREELDAQQAQLRQQHPHGRPHSAHAAPVAPAAPRIEFEKASDLTDLPAVWIAARNYLSQVARLLESVLGPSSSIAALDRHAGELTLLVPRRHLGFTNDKARARLEEALKAVTGLPIRLKIEFSDQPLAPPPGADGGSVGGGFAAQRVPPEIMDAVKNVPIVRELMKRLDASVTQVELLDDPQANASEG